MLLATKIIGIIIIGAASRVVLPEPELKKSRVNQSPIIIGRKQPQRGASNERQQEMRRQFYQIKDPQLQQYEFPCVILPLPIDFNR